MKKSPRRKLLFVGVLFLVYFMAGSLGGVALQVPTTKAQASPADSVQQAWQRARQSGRYSYRSAVAQTIFPAPAVTNAGRPPRQDRLGIEGSVDVLAKTLALTLWDDGSFNPQTGLSVKVEDGQAYGRRGQGSWQEMDNVADAFAPGGDPLGFLAGATNIQFVGTESRDFNGLSLTYTHYTFDLDGPTFAAYMQTQLEAQSEKYGPRPDGLELTLPQTYARMTGQGEVWINAQGLPSRLVTHVEMPDQPKDGERVTADVTNDYFDYDLSRLQASSQSLWGNPSAWLGYHLPLMARTAKETVPALLLTPFFLLLVALSIRYWETRPFYVTLASFMIVSMIFSPLFQAHHAEAYTGKLAAAQEAQEARQAEAEAQQNIQTAVNPPNTWDPHLDPMITYAAQAADRKQVADSRVQSTLPSSVASSATAVQAQSPDPLLPTTTDSDSDGLTDDTEAYWGTCAYTLNSTEYNNSDDCDSVANPTDSDGDGLSDDAEVTYLNTYPTSADTDGDSITDTLEIQGFVYNGQTWYLDPTNEDTNEDGIVDGGECDLFSGSGALQLATACADIDTDGTPDFADSDNDGDGINDADDLSPNNVSPDTYNYDDPMLVTINNLEVGQPVLVDVQVRPTNAEYLNYYNQVLDWPTDDEGQIQRHLDTTWATTSNTEYQSTDANAANGDIRLVPMLEVRMPYTSGHYANLPVNSTYYGTNRTLGTAVDDWIDTSKTKAYSMSIDDVDLATGELVVYVPLTVQTDDNDSRVGYTTRLYYEPSQSSWGAAQEYRVVWLVQMLTDECIDATADEDTCARQDTVTVIHSYYDTWKLTGMNVSEEHGLSVGLMYENPSTDASLSYDDQLWTASWNLNNTFMRARDCDSVVNGSCVGNGQRDVTVANLSSKLSSWNLTYTNVTTKNYPHQGYTAYIMMTDTVSILDTVFTTYKDSTVPTILIAQENSSRALNLDSVTGSLAGGVTLNMSEVSVPLQLEASLSWASYEYVSGAWQNYEAEEYLEYLEKTLATDSYFQATDSSQTAEDTAEGKLLWAQIYYAALYEGAESIVEVDNDLMWEPSVTLPETDFNPIVPVNSTRGATVLAGEFASVYVSKKITVGLDETGLWALMKSRFKDGVENGYQFTRYNKGGMASLGFVALFVLLVAIAAVGILVVGLITNNEGLIRTGVIIMSVVSIIVATFYIIAAVQKIVTAVRAATTIASAVSAGLAAGRWFQGVGIIGFLLGVLVTWGVVGVLILTKGLKGVSLGTVLSLAIASTIVLFIYLILDLIGLGIIVLILVLFDALFALFGSKGPTQLLTEAIAATLYDVRYLIKNLDDSDRLKLNLDGVGFTTDVAGFTVGNSFIFTVAVTNTLQFNTYYSFNDLKDRTVFRYYLQADEIDHDSELSQGEMAGEWVQVDSDEARASDVLRLVVPMSHIGEGIDQSLDGELYVTEAYIAPYQGCWKFAGIPTDCTWYKLTGSSHINLGEELVYDILPDTLQEFAQMDWDPKFGDQVDLDNDGLNDSDGTDPDLSSTDTDGDGLTDYYELIYGLDAESADYDKDGLNDAQELLYDTNPFVADSDSDGVNDHIETQVGWLVTYKNYGVTKLTRVWSDPNSTDIDEDTMNDLEEFIFGFHPQVTSDPSSISTLVQFKDLEVTEDSDLLALTRMEESASADVMVDSSGSGNDASCTQSAGSCPTMEYAGRYGYAADFDGNDYLTVGTSESVFDLSQVTVAAWIKVDSFTKAWQAIVTKGDGSWRLHRAGTTSKIAFSTTGLSTVDLVSTTSLSTGVWYHVAGVYDGSTKYIYINGVLDASASVTGSLSTNNYAVRIGSNAQMSNREFDGKIDEVAIFNRGLSASEIQDVMYGRYNPSDLIVKPSADLTYQATVTNTSSTTANGFLTAQSTYVDPAMVNPGVALSFEPSQQLAYFTNELGEENTIYCYGDGTCPSAGVDAVIGNGIDFDGVDDYAVLPTVDDSASPLSMGFWLYVDALPASGQTAMLLDTESTSTNALDIYLNSSGNVVFDVAGQGTTTSAYSFSTHLNTWVHVFFNGYKIYINGSANTSGATYYNSVHIGSGRLGNNMAGTKPFNGRLDEFVYYYYSLEDGTGGGTSTNAIAAAMNGSYYDDDPPGLLFTFEELTSYDGTIFYDSQTSSDNATCTQPACPTLTTSGSGYSGRAITFDGSNDYLTTAGSYSTDSNGEVSVSFYVKMSAYPSSNAYIFDTTSGTDVLDMYITPAGKFVATRQEGTHTSTNSLSLNQWVQVTLTYDKYYSGGWRYDSLIYFNGVLDSTRNYLSSSSTNGWNITLGIGPGRIGSSVAGANFFTGGLDEMNLAFAVYNFDPPSTNIGYQNLASDIRAASCTDVFTCPTLTTGYYGDGATFDGTDDYLTLNQGVNFFGSGKFTEAAWIYPTMTDSNYHGFIGNHNGGSQYRVPGMWVTQQTKIHAGFGDGTNWNAFTTGSILTLNAWNHVVATFDGTTYRIYVNGTQAYSTTSLSGKTPYAATKVEIGRIDNYFQGKIDEVVILPTAVSAAAVKLLMNSTYPAIDIANLYETFSAPAITDLEVSGTADVSDHITTSKHQFNQEVEAALAFQSQIDYPVVDDNSSNLAYYIPFEEVPGSTIFDNLIAYNNNNIEATCTSPYCPLAGVRGQIDRGVYFDGVDDSLKLTLNGYGGWAGPMRTISVWVNAKQGTIVDVVNASYGLQLDMNQLVTYNSSSGTKTTTALSIPRDTWIHLAVTLDSSDVARVYVNGVQVTTSTHDDNVLNPNTDYLYIGRNGFGQDYFQGYMDDFRGYKTALSAAQILSLYQTSAPVMRFEFDEDDDSTSFLDNSVNTYVGQPTTQTCATFTLNSLTVNGHAANVTHVTAVLDTDTLVYDTIEDALADTAVGLTNTFCGATPLKAGIVANGTAVTLGTTTLQTSSAGTTTSQTYTSGSNSITLNWSIASTLIYQPNPAPGTAGRIGNGAEFDGSGIVTVSDTTVPLNLVADFTIGAWIQTTATSVGILVKTDADTTWESKEKAFYLDSTGKPTFVGYGNEYIRSTTAVNDGDWHYVVVTWDYTTGTTGIGKMYIDGVDATGTVTYRTTNADRSTDTLKIGGSNYNSGEAPNIFVGTIDEIGAYRRALTAAEIYSIYLREVRWYRDRATSYVTVDTDSPTIELLSDATYRANGYTQLAIATSDATSSVALLDFGIKGPSATAFTWSGAPQCQDNGVDGANWCPSFDTSTLGGEGKYQIQFRAVDAVGNETTSSIYTFYVDATAPTATSTYTGQWATIASQDDEALTWTVQLSGSLSDPSLSNTSPAVAGSGVDTSLVRVKLVDSANGVTDLGEQQATVNGSTWSINYTITGARPNGLYTIKMSLTDAVGNATQENLGSSFTNRATDTTGLTVGTLKFDERPSMAHFNAWEISDEVISATTTLHGTVSDQANWASEVFALPFEESVGSTTFHDSTPNEITVSCSTANCPTIATSGKFGQALDFDGVNDVMNLASGSAALTQFDKNAVTLSLWVKPDVLSTGIARFVTLAPETAVIRIQGQKLHFYVKVNGTLRHILVSNVLTAGVWQHVAGTYDGETMRAYVNGVQVGSLAIAGQMSSVTNVSIGSSGEPYDGQMDEIAVYKRALTNAELFALAQGTVMGVQSVQTWLEPFDFTEVATPSENWQAATVSNGSWSYAIPANTQGFYNIHLKSTDNNGNSAEEGTVWRGLIDNKAPVITASGQKIGNGSAAQTQYTFTFSDFILRSSTYVQPCAAGELTSLTYSNSTLPQDGYPYQVSATCRVTGHETSRVFKACDQVGLCTTVTVNPTTGNTGDSVAILSPGNQTSITDGNPVTVSGGAYDLNNVQRVEIRVDGVLIDTLYPGGTVTNYPWSTVWTPLTGGSHTIMATMVDALNNTLSDSIVVSTGDRMFIGDKTVNENAGTMSFPVTLSAAQASNVTVNYATSNGTAVAGSDYTTTSGTLTIIAGQTSGNIVVPILDDAIYEGNESFNLTLSNISGVYLADSLAVGTITDNESTPALSVADVQVNENSNATLTVNTTTLSAFATTVTVNTVNGTAVQPADYTALTNSTVTIPAGSSSATFQVSIVNDAIDEPNETFTALLSNPNNAIISDNTAQVTILDDEATPSLLIADVSVAESDVSTFSIDLSGQSAYTVTVNYATVDGVGNAGAVAPGDYPPLNGTFTFAPGMTSIVIDVATTDDLLDELNETFSLVFTNPSHVTLSNNRLNVLIFDNDATPAVSLTDLSVAESGTAVLTATLDNLSAFPVTVHLQTSDGTATSPSDYTVISQTLTVAPGTNSTSVAIPIIDDLIDEPNETFNVALSDANHATLGTANAQITILDNESLPTLGVGDLHISEGQTRTLTVTLASLSAYTVTVDVATSDGTAVQPGDYTPLTGTLTFAPGSQIATVSLIALEDLVDEPNETFRVNLSNVTNATLSDNSALITIVDDDALTTMAATDVTVSEADTATITVTLSNPSAYTVTVVIYSADDSATAPSDYPTVSQTLTFTPGQTSLALHIPLVDDLSDEPNERFGVVFTDVVNADIVNNLSLVTIVDNDDPPALSVADLTLGENAILGTAWVSLDNASAFTVTVDVATADGTAIAPDDYAPFTDTLTFPPGTSALSVTLTLVDDNLDESDESFALQISNAVSATIGTSSAQITIADDDFTPLGSADTYTPTEDSVFTVPAPGVLLNDSDGDGDPLTAALAGLPTHGQLQLGSDGRFVYTPTLNFNGNDVFSYTLSDGTNTGAVTAVTLHVLPVNDPPIADDDGFAVLEDSSDNIFDVLNGDSDMDGDSVFVSAVGTPDQGGTVVMGNVVLAYTPAPNFHGTETFTYTVSDGHGGFDTALVTVDVASVNDAPIVQAGDDATAVEGDVITFTGSYLDPGFRAAAVGAAATVGIHWDFGDGAVISGTLTPTHTYADNGTFTVTLTITDTEGAASSDSLLMTISNAAPTLAALSDQAILLGDSLSFLTTFTDPGLADTHSATVDWGDGTVEAAAVNQAAGQVSGNHGYTAVGTYLVIITLRDDDDGEATQSFTVTVTNPQITYMIFLPVGVRN